MTAFTPADLLDQTSGFVSELIELHQPGVIQAALGMGAFMPAAVLAKHQFAFRHAHRFGIEVAVLEELGAKLQVSNDRVVYVGDGSSGTVSRPRGFQPLEAEPALVKAIMGTEVQYDAFTENHTQIDCIRSVFRMRPDWTASASRNGD